jgi:hypothetical protein
MEKLVLAVILTIMQTAPPVPGNASNNPTAASPNIKNDAKKVQNHPTNLSVTSKQMDPVSPDRNTGKQGNKDAEHTIGISKLPPVTVNRPSRDLADWAYWGFSALLAVVGGLQVWLLLGTLTTIKRQVSIMERQTKATEDTVKAAQDSAEAAKNNIKIFTIKERARISVDKPEKLALNASLFNSVQYEVQVSAPTPAIVVDARHGTSITDSPDLPQNIFPHGSDIQSKDARTSGTPKRSTVLFVQVDERFIEQVKNKQKFVHFYGYIRYRDAFQTENDPPRETKFSYLWRVGRDILGGIPKVGEPYFSEWVENPPGSNSET